MAGFTDTLRGYGLARAQRALAELERDPQRLDRARTRFDDSPPPYTSDRSGTTTRSQSPDPRSEEQRRHQERLVQRGLEADASRPDKQFRHQIREEEERVSEASLNGTRRIPVGSDAHTIAREKVKKLWVEQGIWNNKWDQFAYGRWKHEEPLELEQPESDDEKRRIAERRVLRERKREASRPYHQFVYQISKERERTQEESENGEGADAADINTRAYENVRNTWTKRKIWNGRWGILPGMSWKHEEPLEEAADGPAPVPANPHVNGSHDMGEAPARRIFGSPSPAKSNCRQTSGTMNASQQRPSGVTDTARLENSDVEPSPSEPNSPRFRTGKLVLHPTTGQASRPSDGLSLSSSVDAAEPQPSPPPNRVTPRRSERIQPPVPSVAKDPAKTASTDPSRRSVRSKPERKVASNLTTRSSAKPGGVSKRQPAKTTRGKARKK
ncbi:MAG: hypothetical protein M1840_004406 [Geoglossum simile]|nr:MAG: hypothetical protein M1840_004406 [Geoglossum simile]